jgi:hypothetical protein
MNNMKWGLIALLLKLACVTSYAGTTSVGALSIDIPTYFRAIERHQKDSLGDLEVNRWESEDGRVFQLLYYADFPKQDRGSMVISAQEPIEVVGQKASVMETTVFFGEKKKALVVYLNIGKTIYIIESEHMLNADFRRILKTLQILKG